LIKENKLWLGYGFAGGNAYFKIPPEKAREFAAGVYDTKTGLVKFRNVGWYTNLYVDRSENPLTPYLTYEQGRKKGLYPKYDNYNAIEVSKLAEIPIDYNGVMGVPITFLDYWTPDSGIEIVKFRKGDDDKDLAFTRERESTTVLQNTHQASSESSDLTDISRETLCQTNECTSTEKKSMHESLSSGFEIIGNVGSYAPDGYSLASAIYINGKKVFKRIIIRRRQ